MIVGVVSKYVLKKTHSRSNSNSLKLNKCFYSGANASRGNHDVILGAGGSKNESVFVTVHDSQMSGVRKRHSATRSESQHRCRFNRGGWSVTILRIFPDLIVSKTSNRAILSGQKVIRLLHDLTVFNARRNDLARNRNSY